MKAKKPWHIKEVMVNLYLEAELTIRQIAGIFSLAPSTVLYWLRKHEIQLREYDIGNVNRGKTLPDEQKQKISDKIKLRHATYGHPLRGRTLSNETKKKIRVAAYKRRKQQVQENIKDV